MRVPVLTICTHIKNALHIILTKIVSETALSFHIRGVSFRIPIVVYGSVRALSIPRIVPIAFDRVLLAFIQFSPHVVHVGW